MCVVCKIKYRFYHLIVSSVYPYVLNIKSKIYQFQSDRLDVYQNWRHCTYFYVCLSLTVSCGATMSVSCTSVLSPHISHHRPNYMLGQRVIQYALGNRLSCVRNRISIHDVYHDLSMLCHIEFDQFEVHAPKLLVRLMGGLPMIFIC